MSSIRSNIQQYINTNQDNITSAKNALTIAQKSEFSPELYIVIFFISFVILSIVVYFFQGFVSSKKAKK